MASEGSYEFSALFLRFEMIVSALTMFIGLYSLYMLYRTREYFRGRMLSLSWILLASLSGYMFVKSLLYITISTAPSIYERTSYIESGFTVIIGVTLLLIIRMMYTHIMGTPLPSMAEEPKISLESPILMFLELAASMDPREAEKAARTIGVEFAEKHRGILEADPLGLARVVDILRQQLGVRLYHEPGPGMGSLVMEAPASKFTEYQLRLLGELLAAFFAEAASISHRVPLSPRVKIVPGPGVVRIIVTG